MIKFSSQTVHLCCHFSLCSHFLLGSDFYIVTFSYCHCSFSFNGSIFCVCVGTGFDIKRTRHNICLSRYFISGTLVVLAIVHKYRVAVHI